MLAAAAPLADRSTVAVCAHAEDIRATASVKLAPNVASEVTPSGAFPLLVESEWGSMILM
jgi:hypothetical protein